MYVPIATFCFEDVFLVKKKVYVIFKRHYSIDTFTDFFQLVYFVVLKTIVTFID
jgi:hypothetical protein